MNKDHAIIIGAGMGGLASAIRLASKGYRVDVYESNAYPGGKLTQIRLGGFRFDAGPSLFTMPQLVAELLEKAPERPEFDYIRLKTNCHYFYEDGTTLIGHADKEEFIKEAVTKTGADANKLRQAFASSATMYEYLGEMFMFKTLRSIKTWTDGDALKAYMRLPSFKLFSTMHEVNRHQSGNDKITQLFNRFATYNGSDPYQAPATLNIIRELEFSQGAFFPKGGMHCITESLYEAARNSGVNFHFNSPVSKIHYNHDRVTGITVGDNYLEADLIVSNSDMTSTYHQLLSGIRAPKKLVSQEKSSSALIFYWGISRQFSQLDLHNILFSADYKKEFDHIFGKRTICDDPTVYINITSKYHAQDAPEGCENWFVMINVPSNHKQDWDALIVEARKNIIKKINRMLDTDIEPLIMEEDYLDPRRIESRTSSWQGALYGNSSNNRYAAFLRHPNQSPHFKNLYFAGGSVHPGGGIPLALSSAKIIDQYIS